MINWVLGCALIGIRASACSARGQMIVGTGPQAASKIANQGNYRGRNDSDCAGGRQAASCRNDSDWAAARKPPVTWNVERETWNQAYLVK